jgi:hypothetical protein
MRALPKTASFKPDYALSWNRDKSFLSTCKGSISHLDQAMSPNKAADTLSEEWLWVERKASGHYADDRQGF